MTHTQKECLFCAVKVTPGEKPQININGTETIVKTETERNNDDEEISSNSKQMNPFCIKSMIHNDINEAEISNSNPNILSEQLLSIFIVRKILDLSENSCANFLKWNNGESCPETWFSICSSCQTSVTDCYRLQVEMVKIKRQLEKQKDELKEMICQTTQSKESKANEISCQIRLEVLQNRKEDLALFKLSDLKSKPVSKVLSRLTRRHRKRKQIVRRSATTATSKKLLEACSQHENADIDYADSNTGLIHQDLNENPDFDVPSPASPCNDDGDDDDDWVPPSRALSQVEAVPRCIKDEEDQVPSGRRITKKRKQKERNLSYATDYICDECPAIINRNKKRFIQHCDLHKTGGGEACPHCQVVFQKEYLYQHILRKHPTARDVQLKIQKYNEWRAEMEEKKKHRRKKAIVKSTRNSRRQKTYNINYKECKDYNRVMKKDAGIPYYCDHCHMIYPYEAKLVLHMRKYHSSEPLVSCNVCGLELFSKQLLQLHRQMSHPDDQEKHTETEIEQSACTYCPKVFPSVLKRDYHISIAHKDTLLTCKDCGFKCKRECELQEHIVRKHTQEKTNLCDLCPQAFKNRDMLNYHRKAVHYEELGIETFKCKFCGNTYGNLQSLECHEKYSHMKVKENLCSYCGKGFSRKCDLNKHVLLHTAPKEKQYKKGPFFCEHCGDKFNVRQGLYYHLKRIHSDKFFYRCDKCGKGYCSKATLYQHERTCKSSGSSGQVPASTATSPVVDAGVESIS